MSLRDALRIREAEVTDETVYRDRRRLLALMAAAPALGLAGCAALPPGASTPYSPNPLAQQALASPQLTAPLTAEQRQQWLDRVTWGATDSDDAQLQKLGLKNWLALQLRPNTGPLPAEAQQRIAALDAKNTAEQADLKRELGDKFEPQMELAKRAARQFGGENEVTEALSLVQRLEDTPPDEITEEAKQVFARWMKAARAAAEAGLQGIGGTEACFFEVRKATP